MTTVEQIRRVLDAHPSLTYHGFESPKDPTFAAHRAELLAGRAVEEVEASLAYLAHVRKTTRVRPKAPSSYGMKHYVEKWAGANGMTSYVSNGAFLAAALIAGFPIERPAHMSLNAGIGVYRKDIDRMAEQANAAISLRRAGVVLLPSHRVDE